MRLAERRFRLELAGIDEAFDDDLGLGRHHQIDGLAFHDIDRAAGEPAGHGELVEMLGHLLHGGVRDNRRTADHDRAGHRFAAFLVFQPVRIDASA